MKLDLNALLSYVNDTSEPVEYRVPKHNLTGRSLFSKYEESSGSYRALLGEDGKYMLCRMPTLDLPGVELGRVTGECRAKRLLDWWVKHDSRLKRILVAEKRNHPAPEDLLDLIMEAAHAC